MQYALIVKLMAGASGLKPTCNGFGGKTVVNSSGKKFKIE